MKKKILLLGAMCVASSVLASDVVLNIQLNGQEMEDGHKAGKVMERGILVIEDFGSETNSHAGTLYLLGNKNGKGNGNSSYSSEDAIVNVLSSNQKQFGMLVELDGAYLAGIGRVTADNNGGYKQIIISSGQGAFLHADFSEPPVDTNEVESVESSEIEDLSVGKMQARLNKKLTEDAKDSDGNTAVEDWFEENNVKARKN